MSEDKKICGNLGSRDCEREVETVLVKLRVLSIDDILE